MKKKDNTVDARIGARLRARREALRLSQKAIGEILDVSYQQVQKYEKGQDHLKAVQIKTLCERLDAPLSYFFGGSSAQGLAEDGAAFVGAGASATAQAHDLMQSFLAIRSQATRDAVVELARRLAAAESEAAVRSL